MKSKYICVIAVMTLFLLTSCSRGPDIDVFYNEQIMPGKAMQITDKNISSYDGNNGNANSDDSEIPLQTSEMSAQSSSEVNVYVTPEGKKYHLSKTCGGAGSVMVTLEDAESKSLTQCKKCVK